MLTSAVYGGGVVEKCTVLLEECTVLLEEYGGLLPVIILARFSSSRQLSADLIPAIPHPCFV